MADPREEKSRLYVCGGFGTKENPMPIIVPESLFDQFDDGDIFTVADDPNFYIARRKEPT
jgi:hypothetical protein